MGIEIVRRGRGGMPSCHFSLPCGESLCKVNANGSRECIKRITYKKKLDNLSEKVGI